MSRKQPNPPPPKGVKKPPAPPSPPPKKGTAFNGNPYPPTIPRPLNPPGAGMPKVKPPKQPRGTIKITCDDNDINTILLAILKTKDQVNSFELEAKRALPPSPK